MESGSSKARPWRQNPSKTGEPEEITVSIPHPDPRSNYHESDKEDDRAFRLALPSLRRRIGWSGLLSRAATAEWAGLDRTEETGEEAPLWGFAEEEPEYLWWIYSPLRPCLDVVGFTSIHMCWSGLGWNLVQVPLQSTPTHVDWCEFDYIQTRPKMEGGESLVPASSAKYFLEW